MSPVSRSEVCERVSEEISAFVDGELPFPESLAAVDHMATCEGCRRFYLDSRRLAEQLAHNSLPSANEKAWQEIQKHSGREAPLLRPGRRHPARWAAGAAVAAVLLLAFLASLNSLKKPAATPGRFATAPLSEIVIEGSKGQMTDERFISLLAEILAADKKYHRETERVLRFVLGRENAVESDDRDTTAGETEREQENRKERAHEKSAGLSS